MPTARAYGLLAALLIAAFAAEGIAAQAALPPDNDSLQFYVNGGYQFTPTTRLTFGVSQSKQTQDDDFNTTATNGRTSLDGEVETTLLNLGLTSRPLSGLTLGAKLRYEDRDDDTQLFTATQDEEGVEYDVLT